MLGLLIKSREKNKIKTINDMTKPFLLVAPKNSSEHAFWFGLDPVQQIKGI